MPDDEQGGKQDVSLPNLAITEYVCNHRGCPGVVYPIADGRWAHADVRLDMDHPAKPVPRSSVERAEREMRRRDAGERALLALEREVAWLDQPFGMHTYNRIPGIHDNDCLACAQRERFRAILAVCDVGPVADASAGGGA